MISLYTSIPAVGVHRHISSQGDTPIDVIVHVIDSWRAAGLDPTSINTVAEANANTNLQKALDHLDIKLVLSDSTKKAGFPDHLPNFKHFVEIASKGDPSDWICISNSDILLTDPSSLVHCINSLTSQCFGIGQRTDVLSLEAVKSLNYSQINSPYMHGIDFFIVSKAQLLSITTLIDNTLTFGLPWWDLILPVLLCTRGFQPRRLNPTNFAHIIHDARQWNWHFWNCIGFANFTAVSKQLKKVPNSDLSSQLAPFLDISTLQFIKFCLMLSLARLPRLSRFSSRRRFPDLEVASNKIMQLLLQSNYV